MSQTITLLLDEPLLALIEQMTDRWLQTRFAQRPQPDPQFTAQEVAELLALDVGTIRSYFKKPEGHIRRLPFVKCSDTSRGNRVRLSDVLAWQERNLIDTLNQAEQQVFDRQVAGFVAKRRARRNRHL